MRYLTSCWFHKKALNWGLLAHGYCLYPITKLQIIYGRVFEFEPGVNIVVGPNASGKTNLLESVLVLARGSSYRVKDPELIKHDQPWARLDGQFEKHTRTLKLDFQGPSLKKTLTWTVSRTNG